MRRAIRGGYVLKSAQEVGFRWRHTIPPDRQSVIAPVLTYSTYLAGFDKGQGIAVDFSGNAYVTGFTQSTDFPGASSSPIQSSRKAVRAPSWPRSTVLAARSTVIPALQLPHASVSRMASPGPGSGSGRFCTCSGFPNSVITAHRIVFLLWPAPRPPCARRESSSRRPSRTHADLTLIFRRKPR